MASDEIINEIWEVAQENSIDPIDKDEFGKDLRKAVFAELERATEGVISDINNEFSRALPIILYQAKANPELIYENNGKGFSVASGILTKAVLTVKYENRYIPGTAEYKKEFPKESLAEVVLTGAVVDAMIENFENLSYEERITLNNNWKNLTSKQRKDILGKTRKQIQNSKDLSDEEKGLLDTVYASEEKVEDSEMAFEDLPPEKQAEFAKSFLDEVSAEDPQKAEVIKNLRAMQLTDVEIRQMLMDDHRNLFQKADALYIEVSNGNSFAKTAMNQAFRDVENEATLFEFCAERAYGIIGVKKVKHSIEDTTKLHQISASKKYAKETILLDYNEVEQCNEEVMTSQEFVGFDIMTGDFVPQDNTGVFYNPIEKPKNSSETKEKNNGGVVPENPLINMVKNLSEEEFANLFAEDIKALLLQKAEEMNLSDDAKRVLEALFESKDDETFETLFYDDRDGFIEELEKMSLLQHAKKQPVTDQEYGPTYRANAEEMVVDSKGLYKAQTDYKKYNEYDGTGTGEGSDASTTGTTVVQDNDTLEVDTINTHQPMPNSFINTARREDTDKDGKDLKDIRDGEGLEDLPPENDLPDNAAPSNSAKNANFISAARNMRASTGEMQDIGNITLIKMKEIDEEEKKKTEPNAQQQGAQQPGGVQQGDENNTTELGEIE